jgi:hypothetical protein
MKSLFTLSIIVAIAVNCSANTIASVYKKDSLLSEKLKVEILNQLKTNCKAGILAYGLTETSRLGCQVIVNKELFEGATIILPASTNNLYTSDIKNK